MRFTRPLVTKRRVLAIALLTLSRLAYASGGDGYSENIFTPEYHVPASELASYVRDNLRITAPTYWRVYHFISYRALTGHALSKNELDALNISGWKVGKDNGGWDQSSDPEQNGVALWMTARKTVAHAAGNGIDVETAAGEYESFLNCHRDAFARASQTLAQRLAQQGQQWTLTWLANQDAVFANCSPQLPNANRGQMQERPLTMPPDLPAKAPEWLVKDHAYQRASALFYAGRYDEARQRYLDIAKDGKSSWQPLGKYLAARCLVRKATLTPDAIAQPGKAAPSIRASLLASARSEFSVITATYAPAKAMLDWIDIRLRPEERRRELSVRLAKDKINADTWQQLTDYLVLLDKIEGASMVAAEDDMSAWIGSMQAAGGSPYASAKSKSGNELRKAALDKARSYWKKSGELHWLVAILTNAMPDELTPEETKAASSLRDDSPAYGMAQYYLARNKLSKGKLDDADATITAMLGKTLAPSIRNRWLRLKMVSARTPAEFFAAAPRTIVDNQQEAPPTNEGKIAKPEEAFDDDLAQHMTQHFSLDALKRYRSMIPAQQQKWIGELMWTRAVILGDFATADALTDELAKGRDTTRHLYERFKKTTTAADKQDAAFVILANTPELTPYVSISMDGLRGSSYWSCDYAQAPSDDMGNLFPAFLPPEMRIGADNELKELGKLPKRSAYLIPPIINWAKKHKADPEAPKALHFLVASTRNECGTGANEKTKGRNFSREAFQFLHMQFPKSEWTVQTRYYYQ